MTNLKCHFDSDGWLRGPINITHVMTPNRYNSGFRFKARGMVQHTEAGFEAGTVATFLNPSAQVSAFFSVGETGAAHQYLPVGRGLVAWAEGHGNPEWYSCECEDKLRPGDAMPDPQLTAFAQILEATSEHDVFPLEITHDPASGRGLITHGAGGVRWGNHPSCPGSVRKAQQPEIIRRAKAIRAGGGSPPAPSVRKWESAGQLTLHDLCRQHLKEFPSTVLRITVGHGGFSSALAGHVDAVFAGDDQVCPAGVTWHYPGGDWATEGQMSLSALAAAELKATPSQVLALTASHSPDGQFLPNAAEYVNAVFGRTSIRVPKGAVICY